MDRAINHPANRAQTKNGYSFASNKTDAEALAAWQANPLPDLDGEEWKPIDWIDDVDSNMYMVSNMGRVKNVAKYYQNLEIGMDTSTPPAQNMEKYLLIRDLFNML